MSSAAAYAKPLDIAAPTLSANGKTLDKSPARLGTLTPTPADTPIAQLHEQFRAQGYLWLKRFLDPAIVNAYRGRVFSHLAATGLVEPGTDPALGISATGAFDKSLADRALMALVRSAGFEAFCMQPVMVDFMDQFLTGLSYLHKRKIMRFTQPNSGTVRPGLSARRHHAHRHRLDSNR